MKKLTALLLVVLLLTGCSVQRPLMPQHDAPPASDPEVLPDTPPEDPAPEPEPVPVPEPEPEPALVYTVSDAPSAYLYDGQIAVSITTPVFDLENDGAEAVINRYFALLSGKVRDYAEGDLPQQITVPAVSGPTFTVSAGYEITGSGENYLSVLWRVETDSAYEMPNASSLSAATFDPATGNLLLFSDLFGKNTAAARALFVAAAREQIESRKDTYYYYELWYDLADSALYADNFFLTGDGVGMFYPAEALGTATEVLLSYDALAELLTVQL